MRKTDSKQQQHKLDIRTTEKQAMRNARKNLKVKVRKGRKGADKGQEQDKS